MISQSNKENMHQVIHKMAESSLRTLCLAYKPIDKSSNVTTKDAKGVYDI